MALWMDSGSEPKTNEEIFDLDAIAALKQSTAIELKVPIPISDFYLHYNYIYVVVV